MLNDKQIPRMLRKLTRFEKMLFPLIFDKVGEIDMKSYQTKEQLYAAPDKSLFKPVKKGDVWGDGEYTYCWFDGTFKVPAELSGKRLYLSPKVGGYEALLFVDGKPYGIFANKLGNHYCGMIAKEAVTDQDIDVTVEFYSGHYYKGCMPFETEYLPDYNFTYNSMDVCVKNEELADFYFDLRTVNELQEVLDDGSFRKGELINVLYSIHEVLYYSPENCSKEEFISGIRKAAPILKEALSKHNPASAPEVSVIGHSHMDTVWLWPMRETIKKCARTYSNQMSLMDQYEEYNFIQSSAYHSEMIEKHYPELFDRIKQRVKEGRYEPNGGVWIECDCNITSGESMIRQFLWGQRYTQEKFGYKSDAFWLPDTFGYSAAIPQILKGCDIDYFLTTKMAWNDTNLFPYDSFYWKGIDGSVVFSHLNKTHIGPTPRDMYDIIHNEKNPDGLRQKYVTNKKLVSYGVGDGGGGPEFEMIEMSRRIKDVDGCPKVKNSTVSQFMKELETTANHLDTYSGELYLELHRGTLTNQHEIKRNNKDAEVSVHNLEFLTVQKAVKSGAAASDSDYRDLVNTMLVNQFHDILPGTCYNVGNSEAKVAVAAVVKSARQKIDAFGMDSNDNIITIVNTTSYPKTGTVYADCSNNVSGNHVFEDINGCKKLAFEIDGELPSYGSVKVDLSKVATQKPSPFKFEGNSLVTPFANVTFDEKMYFSSFIDLRNGRELKGEGYSFNTFLVAEDVPDAWDNWDVDADLECKFKDAATLLSTKVITDNALEFRIRNEYRITEKSTLKQDVIFSANSALVKFETVVDWNDRHRFLKTAFDTTVMAEFAKSEIQFGYLSRPTFRNTSMEKAKFEVLNHKYTDLSEHNYGVTILNDCKYAISLYEGQMRLSLHKGGERPDTNGDMGSHYFEYGFLPHEGGFSADNVVKPAYMFSYKPVLLNGDADVNQLVSLTGKDCNNVVIETIKPCEDVQNAFIVRLYDAVGSYSNVSLKLGFEPKGVDVTNMLEQVTETLISGNAEVPLTFKPFEIKTLKLFY